MPLHDHFRSPLNKQLAWEELHGQWPAVIVQQLRRQLPPGFVAGPRVHLGSMVEIDVATYGKDAPPPFSRPDEGDGGVATATWAPPVPSVDVETDLPDLDEYEVRIYDAERERRLVAAIEIVSPANKDRPEHRAVFVAKCAALVQKGVAVSIVDLVTVRLANLYVELLALLGASDPTLGDPPPAIYAASVRWVPVGLRTKLQAWSRPLRVGQPLPTLPLWLSEDRVVPLDLEASYDQACRDLWIE